eukprot:1152533-Pelagomonas_calceolata.AAC.2
MARDKGKCATTQRDAPQKKDKRGESTWKSPNKIQVTPHTLDYNRPSGICSTLSLQHTFVVTISSVSGKVFTEVECLSMGLLNSMLNSQLPLDFTGKRGALTGMLQGMLRA